MNQGFLLLFSLLIAAITFTQAAMSQDTTVCAYQYSDADGDGFGWENLASCVVTEDSEPPPNIINEETGQPVELIRPHWDGNSDIANRVIQCDLYYFADDSRSYVQDRAKEFNHLPIPSTSPYLGWLASWSTNGAPYWTIRDGLYRGPTLLTEEYIEVITNSFGNKAIRIWVNEGHQSDLDYRWGSLVEEDGFYQCRDTAGEDFMPTGQPGQASAISYELSDLTVSVRSEADPQTEQELVNLETGLPVVTRDLYWDVNKDLAGKSISCTSNRWNGSRYNSGDFDIFEFNYHLQGSSNELNYHAGNHNGSQSQGVIPFEDGIISVATSAVLRSEPAEVIDTGVRYWISSEWFIRCSSLPTGSALIEPDGTLTDNTSDNLANGNNELGEPEAPNSIPQQTSSDSEVVVEVDQVEVSSEEIQSSDTINQITSGAQSESNVTSNGRSGGGAMSLLFLLLMSSFVKILKSRQYLPWRIRQIVCGSV